MSISPIGNTRFIGVEESLERALSDNIFCELGISELRSVKKFQVNTPSSSPLAEMLPRIEKALQIIKEVDESTLAHYTSPHLFQLLRHCLSFHVFACFACAYLSESDTGLPDARSIEDLGPLSIEELERFEALSSECRAIIDEIVSARIPEEEPETGWDSWESEAGYPVTDFDHLNLVPIDTWSMFITLTCIIAMVSEYQVEANLISVEQASEILEQALKGLYFWED